MRRFITLSQFYIKKIQLTFLLTKNKTIASFTISKEDNINICFAIRKSVGRTLCFAIYKIMQDFVHIKQMDKIKYNYITQSYQDLRIRKRSS